MKNWILTWGLATALVGTTSVALANSDTAKDPAAGGTKASVACKSHSCKSHACKSHEDCKEHAGCKAHSSCKSHEGCSGHEGHHGHGDWHEAHKQEMDQFLTSIGVTADQKKQLETIKADAEAQTEPLRKGEFEQRHDLMHYMATPEATEAEALSREHALSQLHDQETEIRVKSIFKMKAVLTPEQQQKFAAHLEEKMKEFEQKGFGGHHHGDGMPGGPM